MKRKTLIISLALIATLSIGGSVAASSNLNSKGTININADTTTDGYEVVIDSNDLAVLDSRIDELDTLVTEGKSTLADAINEYPNQNVQALDTFTNLSTTISTLTEVPDIYYYDKATEGDTCQRYIYEDGLYYPCDEHGIKTSDTALSGTITVVSKDDTSTPTDDEVQLVKYTSTDDTNLSAGYAGYVDKTFILGSGVDNINYGNSNKGIFVKILSEFTGSVNIANLYPDIYEKLTVNNFICDMNTASMSNFEWGDVSVTRRVNISKSYSNGVFTIKYNNSTTNSQHPDPIIPTGNVYLCYIPD